MRRDLIGEMRTVGSWLFHLWIGAWLLLDCLGSVLVGESFMHTLSAKAHDAALHQHKYWGWTERFINRLFWRQKGTDGKRNHCQQAWVTEQKFGTIWAAWWSDFGDI